MCNVDTQTPKTWIWELSQIYVPSAHGLSPQKIVPLAFVVMCVVIQLKALYAARDFKEVYNKLKNNTMCSASVYLGAAGFLTRSQWEFG